MQFAVDGSNYGAAVSLSGGSATIADAALSGGTHTITASYSGDTNFSTSSGTLSGGQTVNPAGTSTAVAKSVEILRSSVRRWCSRPQLPLPVRAPGRHQV